MGEKMHERALGDLQIEVAALRATVERLCVALGGLIGGDIAWVTEPLSAPAPDAAPGPRYPGESDRDYWFRRGVEYAEGQIVTAAPAPPADAPLPGQVADAVMVSATGPLSAEDYAAIRDVADAARRRMASAASAEMQRDGLLLPLPPEVESALAVIRKASDAGLFDAKPETSRALAAWARAQQQPALGADVREAMREAAAMLHHVGSASYIGVDRDDAVAIAARLRELAGEP